jgi:beta-glucanase (GH16 family)
LPSGTCAADPAISDAVTSIDFTTSKSLPSGWELVNQGSVTYDGNGANLILAKQGDSPILQTTGYILFGSLSVTMKAASGQGIVSSLVLLSDDLDELDWEFTGTNTAQVQSNYFGKGDTTTYNRAAWHSVASPQTTTHTYTFDWTPSAVTWSIDGAVVRTLNYADAQGGARFPQTPMRVRLGIWAGGDPSNGEGTIEWAGGPTDYSQAPFSMSVQSVTVKNYSPAKSYTYGDTSGSYESIQIDGGSLMSSTNGDNPATASGAKMTTSLSIASQPTNNPLTAAPTTSAVMNITNQTTLSSVPKPTSSNSTGSGKPSNAAYRLDSADMTGLSSMLFGAVALGMGLFF